MAKRRQMWETKVVRTERAAARLIEQGWEVVSSTSSGTWFTGRRTAIILRRLNPKYRGTIAEVHSVEETGDGLTIRGRMRRAEVDTDAWYRDRMRRLEGEK